MSKHDNIYSILGKLASLEPQPPKQQNILKQLNESAVVATNPLSLKDRLAQKLAETKEVDEDMLAPKQKKLDKNDNGKIDANDLAALRAGKTKEKEGNEFSGELAKAKAQHKDSFSVDGKTYPVKEAEEHTMSRAAKGYEKYGKEGMQALAKAGKEGKDLDKVRDKYNKYKDDVNEGEYQDGPNKSDVPAFQRKAKAAPGDDSWKTSQQDLDDEASKSPTGAAGLAKAKARLGMNEAIDFDKVLDAIAALYGEDMWENDAMQDLAQELEQAGPTDKELDFIIAKGKLPKRLAGIQFSAGDSVQFGEGGMREEQYDENNAHSSLPGTRRVSDEEHSEYDAAAHTVRKWMRKRGWDPKSEFKPAMKYIIDNLDATHDDTLTDDVKMAACTCRKHHGGIVDEGWDDMMKSVKDRSEQGTGKFDVQKTSTGTRYTRKPETFDSGDDDGEEKSTSDGPKKKGRPAKAKAPERTTSKAWKHKGARVTEAINLETYVEDTMAEIEALFIIEKDMGKHNNATTGFKALAKKAGGGEKGQRIAGAQFQKMKKAGQLEEAVLTESTLQSIVRKFGKEVREFAEGGDFDQDLFEALYDYYFDDMPYGVKKARDGDPYEWVADHFHDAIQSGDVEINETKVGHKDLDELAALAGIGGKQQMESSCNMTAEGQMCPEHGMVECGGMMYEGEEKPDFLDVDKDDDKEEPMKKAIGDKWKPAKTSNAFTQTAPYPSFKKKNPVSNKKEELEECGMPPMGGMVGTEEAESGMSINTSMDTKTGRKTVTVTADGEAAEELASMLRMAGMGGAQSQPQQKHIDVVIGRPGGQEVDEEYANEPNVQNGSTRAIMQQGNDLNKPKSMYKHNYRGGDNPMSMKEDKLFKLYDAMKSR